MHVVVHTRLLITKIRYEAKIISFMPGHLLDGATVLLSKISFEVRDHKIFLQELLAGF